MYKIIILALLSFHSYFIPTLEAQMKTKSVRALKIQLEGKEAETFTKAFGVNVKNQKNIFIDANGENDFSIRATVQSFQTPSGIQNYYYATLWINTDVFRLTPIDPTSTTNFYRIKLIAGTAKTIFDKLMVPEKEEDQKFIKSFYIKDQLYLTCSETKNLINPMCEIEIWIP